MAVKKFLDDVGVSHLWSKIKELIEDTAYTHPETSGNKHIPSGGSEGQILKWSEDGTAIWGEDEGVRLENIVLSSTLLASDWTGSESPYTNTIVMSDSNVDNYEVGYIELSNTATDDQQEALVDAEIGSDMDYDKDTRSITFYAYGEKPTVDIPLQVTFSASMDIVENVEYIENGGTGGNNISFGTEPNNPNHNQIWFEVNE